MSALKAKDLNRLTDATALRAGTDADTAKRNQDMFRRVKEGTLSESELNDLAALLEGYKVSGFNQAKSSGKLGVILSKARPDADPPGRSSSPSVARRKAGASATSAGPPSSRIRVSVPRRGSPNARDQASRLGGWTTPRPGRICKNDLRGSCKFSIERGKFLARARFFLKFSAGITGADGFSSHSGRMVRNMLFGVVMSPLLDATGKSSPSFRI